MDFRSSRIVNLSSRLSVAAQISIKEPVKMRNQSSLKKLRRKSYGSGEFSDGNTVLVSEHNSPQKLYQRHSFPSKISTSSPKEDFPFSFSKITTTLEDIDYKEKKINEFWLPKNSLSALRSAQIEAKMQEEISSLCWNAKTEQFTKVEDLLQLKGVTTGRRAVTHICPIIDQKVAVITTDMVIVFQYKNPDSVDDIEIVLSLPLKHIVSVYVDLNLSVIHFVLGHDYPSPIWDIIPGNISKTESFISSLVVNCSQNYVRNEGIRSIDKDYSADYKSSNMTASRFTPFIDVVKVGLTNIPSCKNIKKFVSEHENIFYAGSAIVEAIEKETEYHEDFMMQKGAEKFKPIVLSLKGNVLRTSSLDSPNVITINVKSISSISRSETPRPNTVYVIWKSMSIYLAASNTSIANELFDRICLARRKIAISAPQPAHVILTEFSLMLFSTTCDKALIFQTPLMNVISIHHSENEPSALNIEADSTEAEESMSCENAQWSLKFYDEMEKCTCFELLLNLTI